MIYLFIAPHQAQTIFQYYVQLLKKHKQTGVVVIPGECSSVKRKYWRIARTINILSETQFISHFQENAHSHIIFFNQVPPPLDLSTATSQVSFQLSLAQHSIEDVLKNQMSYTGFTLYDVSNQAVLYQQTVPVLAGDNKDKLQQRVISYSQPIFWQYVESLLENKAWDTKPTQAISCYSDKYLITSLKEFLKTKLPDYMIPAHFIFVDSFPLTPSGKIDIGALPLPGIQNSHDNQIVAPRNAVEHQLANIWQNALGVENISIHDNFFDLGGHSLLAIRVLDRIEKNFNKTLSMLTLFQFPTIAELAEKINQQKTVQHQALEIIQHQGNRPPFFFIGSTSLARALVPHLGEDQPLYGLNIFGLESVTQDPTHLHIQDIAAQCVAEIQAVQPQGPYYLGGYCGDAKVAFEIAQQLTQRGQKVALLASIDGFVDIIWDWQNHRYDLKHHWSNLLELGPSYLMQKIRQKSHRFIRRSRLFLLHKVGENIKRKPQRTLPHQLHYTLFINHYFNALSAYQPQAYPGKITLFFSSELRIKHSPERHRLNAWSQTHEVEIFEIPGYHDNLFVEPQASILGKQLKSCLEASQLKN